MALTPRYPRETTPSDPPTSSRNRRRLSGVPNRSRRGEPDRRPPATCERVGGSSATIHSKRVAQVALVSSPPWAPATSGRVRSQSPAAPRSATCHLADRKREMSTAATAATTTSRTAVPSTRRGRPRSWRASIRVPKTGPGVNTTSPPPTTWSRPGRPRSWRARLRETASSPEAAPALAAGRQDGRVAVSGRAPLIALGDLCRPRSRRRRWPPPPERDGGPGAAGAAAHAPSSGSPPARRGRPPAVPPGGGGGARDG
jgi:hypothetical protein